jgi:hypothetical protein
MIGAFVLPLTSVGMIDPSATPQAVDATNTKRSIDHRHFVIAHLAGAKPPFFFVRRKNFRIFSQQQFSD